MKINSLRKIIEQYKQIGLPIEKRAYIKKQLGRQDYKIAAKEYDSFMRSDILDEQPERIILYDIDGANHASTNVRLKRNFQKINLFTELKKENILDIISSVKKLSKIPVNRFSYLHNNKTAARVLVEQVPNTQNYRLVSKKGEDIGIFSIGTIDEDTAVGNFVINKRYRKTDMTKEAMLAMREFFYKSQYKDIVCAVESDKPFLVRMYEKFGLCVKGILSINENEQMHTYFEMQKEIPRYDIQIEYK